MMGRLDILAGIGRGVMEGAKIAMEIDRNGGLFPNADKRGKTSGGDLETDNRAKGFEWRTDHASQLAASQGTRFPGERGGNAAALGQGVSGLRDVPVSGQREVSGGQGMRLTSGGVPRFAGGGRVSAKEESGRFRRPVGDTAVSLQKEAISASRKR